MKPTPNTLVKEIEFHIKLGDINYTLAIPPTISQKDGKLIINGSRFVFGNGPEGGLHMFAARITDGLTPGRHNLTGGSGNSVNLTYIAPKTNITDIFEQESGFFELSTTATIENIEAKFDCVAKNVNPQITEKAHLSLGKIAFHEPAGIKTTTGKLVGTITPGDYSFEPTVFSMQFVIAPGHPVFLEFVATVDHQRLFFYLPESKLGDGTLQKLPINEDQSGKSAVAALVYNAHVLHAESGEIEFKYNKEAQTLEGDIVFESTETNPTPTKITFTSKKFKITGLTGQAVISR
ncbi:hypothetical protein [Pseudomonas cyclaminis]|uniref:hypothetical protein n=1 Tax=Pseudomonas cyclaminis TaxID=2781239 RepID=UPI00382A7F3A